MDNIVKEVKFNFNSSATDYNDPIEILVLAGIRNKNFLV